MLQYVRQNMRYQVQLRYHEHMHIYYQASNT